MPFADTVRVAHPPRRLPDDDQVTVDSLSYSDDFTLPGDDVDDGFRDYMSDTSVSTRTSFDSYTVEEQLPSYRVPRDHGVLQPVYEAWILRYTGDNKEVINGTKICSINAVENYDQLFGYVDTRPEPYDQADLRAMHVGAIERYQVANKRSLPTRLVRGRAKSYEQDLDDRVRKLPNTVQKELNTLLGDREVATSSRANQRDWTVAMMREQFHYRFSDAAFEEVKRHRVRFWKNPDKKQPIEYFVVLRGAVGKATAEEKGWTTPRRHGNPWKNVDETERRAKEQVKRMKGYEKDSLKTPRVSVHRRSVSPPRRYRRAYPVPPPRPRSVTPPPMVYDTAFRPAPRPHVSYGPPPPPPGMGPGSAPGPAPYPVPAPAPQFPNYPPGPGVPPMPYHHSYSPYAPPGVRYGMPAPPPPPMPAPPPPPPASSSMPLWGYNQPIVNTYAQQPGGQLASPFNSWSVLSAPQPAPGPSVYQQPGMIPYLVAGQPLRNPSMPAPPLPRMPMPMSMPMSSPPRFPPPGPMPSNLTTPTFTATASDRSGPKEVDGESVGSDYRLDAHGDGLGGNKREVVYVEMAGDENSDDDDDDGSDGDTEHDIIDD